jgi:pimeloyl-ACP methyl ester carboxylesterase
MVIQDAAERLHEIVRERNAALGAAADACCGGSAETREAATLASDGGPAAVCPDDREPCPTPLTASEVLARLRQEAPLWSIDRAGRAIHGRTFGNGPPLYLLNGLLGTHELYVLLAWVLREHVRCVLFDWPANGPRAPRGREPIAAFVEDLFGVADFHGDDRFTVFGTSLGGLVALAAMLDQPPRIERAILHGSAGARRLSILERLLVRAGRLLPGTLAGVPFHAAILRQNHRPWFPPFDAARFQFLLDDAGSTRTRTLAGRANVLQRTDLRPRLRAIHQPVLLVRTEGEGEVSARAQEELAAALPDARSEWLHTCGQLPHLTHPHRLAKVLRPFLNAAPLF